MIRTQVYLTEDQYNHIQLEAKRGKKKAAQVLRDVLERGMKQYQQNAGNALLDIAKIAQKGPTDLSTNIDTYLYIK